VDRHKRHGLHDDDGCALCCQESETGTHLFSSYVVTKELWLHALHVLQGIDLHHILVDLGVSKPVEWQLRHMLQFREQQRGGGGDYGSLSRPGWGGGGKQRKHGPSTIVTRRRRRGKTHIVPQGPQRSVGDFAHRPQLG
jgi:hypothetical protein